MRLKDYITFTFTDYKLNVYDHEKHIVYQPYNSDTGNPFRDQDEALAWLLAHFPDLFTPS